LFHAFSDLAEGIAVMAMTRDLEIRALQRKLDMLSKQEMTQSTEQQVSDAG
jgi:hypothetical protein